MHQSLYLIKKKNGFLDMAWPACFFDTVYKSIGGTFDSVQLLGDTFKWS